MIDHKLVIGYIGNGKSANRYHLPFVMQRKDKFIVKSILIFRLDMMCGMRLKVFTTLKMLMIF